MEDSRRRIAADALSITLDEAQRFSREIPEVNAVYVWNPSRDGLAVIVAHDGSKLIAGSAVKYEEHLETFLNGIRN